MAAGGLGVLAIGLRKKDKTDAGVGACFVGNALFGYLAKSNDVYAWFQMASLIALAVLVVIKYRTRKRREKA
jgi:high-affinity Fe2+/Pb2+ permease